MSRSLIKFVDLSLFPAAMMVLGKLLGVYFTIRFFNIDSKLEGYANNFLTLGPSVSEENVMKVTSFSDLFMYAFVVSIFTFVLFRAIYLHSTHVKPALISKLANKNLIKLIQGSYEIYHSAAVTLLYLWIATILILINTFTGTTYTWIGIMSFISSIILTAILFQDVYREIDNIKHRPGDYSWI